MKINKASFNKKPLIITLAVLVIACLGYGVYAATNNQWPFIKTESQQTTSPTSATTAESQKPTGVAEQPAETSEDSPKTPTENEGSTAQPKDQVGVTITSITAHDDVVKVKSLIEAVVNTGTCTLTFEKGDKTVTKTSDIQPMPESSTCKGFNIPVSELGKGTWQVKLSVATGEKAGSANQTYKVQ